MKQGVKYDPTRHILLILMGMGLMGMGLMGMGLMGMGMVIWPSPAHSANLKKPSVVSLDFCADQYVLALADREQIMALSRDADQDHSFYKDRALGLPKFHSSMAEVINLQPDIAVQSWMVPERMEELITRAGTRFLIPQYGGDPEIVMTNIRRMGREFSQDIRAAGLIEDYVTRFEKLQKISKSDITAAYITPSGFTAGKDTFVDKIIQLAGFSSYAAKRNITGWRVLPLEELLIDPPDIFIGSFFDTNLASQSNWSMARHGLLQKRLQEIPTLYLPGRYLSCGGLFLVDAAELIHAKAKEITRGAR